MKIIVFAHGKIKNGPEHELISDYVNRFNKQFKNDFLTSLEISESTEVERQFYQKVSKMLDVKKSTVLLDRNGEHLDSEGFVNFLTSSSEKGINQISISTGIECQGIFEDSYINSFEVKYTPNPILNYLDLFIGGEDELVEIGVYSTNGQLIDFKKIRLTIFNRSYRLQTENYKQGVYIIKVTGANLDQSIQVIKK